ncbi:MAG: hypothetical protein P4L36_10145 [Holophaga sp.]|nr:hypothetical protein [Holophaga sp.]
MRRSLLFGYQVVVGLCDSATGMLLMVAPHWTLRRMGLRMAADAPPLLAIIGALVFGVGLCCLHGAWLAYDDDRAARLDLVWLLTGILRASVAVLVCIQILSGALEPGWLTVALFDGACALLQTVGLSRNWLAHATR